MVEATTVANRRAPLPPKRGREGERGFLPGSDLLPTGE